MAELNGVWQNLTELNGIWWNLVGGVLKYYYKTKCPYRLNKLEQDVEPAAKALVVSGPMAIFHAGHGKS